MRECRKRPEAPPPIMITLYSDTALSSSFVLLRSIEKAPLRRASGGRENELSSLFHFLEKIGYYSLEVDAVCVVFLVAEGLLDGLYNEVSGKSVGLFD